MAIFVLFGMVIVVLIGASQVAARHDRLEVEILAQLNRKRQEEEREDSQHRERERLVREGQARADRQRREQERLDRERKEEARRERERRERANEESSRDRGSRGNGQRPGWEAGSMSPNEAFEVLDLKTGATDKQVLAAYKRLMQRVHPDVGGSNFFAKQLNEARKTLLGTK